MNTETKFSPGNEQGQILELSDLLVDDTKTKEETTDLVIENEEEEKEKEEEVKQPEQKKEEEVEQKKEETVDAVKNPYTELLKKKIASGEFVEIEDIDLETAEIDAELFEQIIDAQIEHKESLAKENTIKVDNLSPMMSKALEVEANGGDVAQIFETYKNIYEDPQNPIAHLDLDEPKDQETILYFFYKQKGLSDTAVKAIITEHKKELTLSDEAVKVKAEIDGVFNNYLDNLVKNSEKLKTERAEAYKQYKNSISESAKGYELNETARKKLVDVIAKPDEKGLYPIDALYDEWRRDPEKAVKLGLFLTNEAEYIKQLTSKAINQEKKETFVKLKLTTKGKSSGNIDYNSSKHKEDEVLDL